MEPKEGLDGYVDCGGEIVAIPKVAAFVCEDGFELIGRDIVQESIGKQEHGTEDSENAGFNQCGRDHRRKWKCKRDRFSGAANHVEFSPLRYAPGEDRERPGGPNKQEPRCFASGKRNRRSNRSKSCGGLFYRD